MATYDELLAIATGATGGALHGRIKVACLVAADKIRLESNAITNHANRLLWARGVLRDPGTSANQMLMAVLAQNRAAAANAITGADDATVQTAVDAAVDLLAQG